ncbi:retrotransposable element Tf2 [Tanacetum coccineum]
MALSHPAIQVAQVFLDNIYKLHGLPNVIVSDRDKVFLSLFWKELFKMLQVSLHFSTAYHSQTYGQIEIFGEAIIKMLQFHLEKAQARMKAAADLHRTDRSFEVGQWLKFFKGDPTSVPPVLPQCDLNGSLVCIPVKVLERRLVKVNNKMVVYVLVQWSNGGIDDATWEIATDLEKKFPEFSFNS